MKSKLLLTIWMNMPSPYQGDLFRALVASGEVDLQVIFARALTHDRLQLGWQNDLSGYPYHFLDEYRPIGDTLSLVWSQRNRIHIVNGLWAEPAFAIALVEFALVRSRYVIYSEAPDPRLSRSLAKRWLRTTFGHVIARRAAGVLSISHLTVEFYQSLGVRRQAIYPFGYFRASAGLPQHSSRSSDPSKTEILFVGQLIHRKGVDLLLEALLPLFQEYPDLRLSVVGDGDMLETLQEQVKSYKLSERVIFEGALSSNKIPIRLQQADVLVLPSRWDGWGLVVNEAFSVGVPVIVSDRCGASELVQHGVNGYVFHDGDVLALRANLLHFLSRKAEWPYLRSNAAATGKKVSTDRVAPYLIRCLKHMIGTLEERPGPPWLTGNLLI